MKTSNLPLGRLILRPLIYGLVTGVIALLIREVLLTEEIRYTSNWTSILLLFIISLGAFVYFKQLNPSLTSIRQLVGSSLIFGASAGIAVGLSYYIDVTMLDPDYLQKTHDTARTSWAEKGYSKDAIAGQVELTDTFQNPLKWSLILTLFYCMLTAGLSFIVGCFTRKDVSPIVNTDDLKHA